MLGGAIVGLIGVKVPELEADPHPVKTVMVPVVAPIGTTALKPELEMAKARHALSEADTDLKRFLALKNVAREDLLALLRTEASYVQLTASDDLPKMLSSGYTNVSTSRTKIALPKPDIAAIDNVNSTELVVRLTPVTNARAYEVQQRTGTGNWQTAGIYTQARRIVLENLAPGATYTVQARAVGGTTGYSDWSDPVSHMAM